MSFTEHFRNRLDELLPFAPPKNVSELLSDVNIFLESELGEDLLLVNHFGSTCDNAKNTLRRGYKPPHRGSDIDLVIVIKDGLDVKKISAELSEKIKDSNLPQNIYELHVINKKFYEYASLLGHPSLLLYAHAKEYGNFIYVKI